MFPDVGRMGLWTLRKAVGFVALPDYVAILGADLKCLYQADDPDTAFSDGRFVTTPDASGNGNTISGGGGTNDPTIAVNPINGRQSFDFVADNVAFMNTPNITHPGISALPFTIGGIISPRLHATAGTQRNVWGGQSPGTRMFVRDDGGTYTLSMYNGGISDAEVAGLVYDEVYCFIAKFDIALMTLKVSGLTTATSVGIGTDGFQQAIMGTNGAFASNTSFEGRALDFWGADALTTADQDLALMAHMGYRGGV